jgi:hypothetical protein
MVMRHRTEERSLCQNRCGGRSPPPHARGTNNCYVLSEQIPRTIAVNAV